MEYDQNAINTVGDLIEALESYDPDTPVRWAHQSGYPFEYTIGQIVHTPDDDRDDDPVVWLGEGHQVGYLSAHANTALGWQDGWAG